MKLITLLLLTLTTCAAVCLCQDKVRIVDSPPPSQKVKPDTWKELSSPEGRFSVSLPGTPVAKVVERKTAAGMIISHVFTLKLPESFYLISYQDYPVYSRDEEWVRKALDAGREGMFGENNGTKLLGEKQIVLGSFPGRELLTLQNQFSFGIMRAFIAGGRLYQIAILVPVDAAFKKGHATLRVEDRKDSYESIAARFFDSFKIGAPPAESLGEVDRMLLYLKQERKDVAVVYATADDNPAPAANTAGVINGKAIHLVAPAYPPIASSAHASGQVSVQVVIDLQGKVIAAQVLDGHPLLRAAAIKAARESEFTASQLDGKPVMVAGVILYNFVAQ